MLLIKNLFMLITVDVRAELMGVKKNMADLNTDTQRLTDDVAALGIAEDNVQTQLAADEANNQALAEQVTANNAQIVSLQQQLQAVQDTGYNTIGLETELTALEARTATLQGMILATTVPPTTQSVSLGSTSASSSDSTTGNEPTDSSVNQGSTDASTGGSTGDNSDAEVHNTAVATVASVTVSPSNQMIASGGQLQFSAVVTLSDGTTEVNFTPTWSCGGGSIDQNGLFTAANDGTTSYGVTCDVAGVTGTVSGSITTT